MKAAKPGLGRRTNADSPSTAKRNIGSHRQERRNCVRSRVLWKSALSAKGEIGSSKKLR